MTSDEDQPALVERVLHWLYRDELRHSRLIWRLEADQRNHWSSLSDALFYDAAGAAVLDLGAHPRFQNAVRPWLQTAATDPAALELLLALRAPAHCEVLVDGAYAAVLRSLGQCVSAGELQVHVCAPGELGPAARPYEPTRLTMRHRAMVAEDGWRPQDLVHETDEEQDGVRWAIIRDGRLAARLLVQRISHGLIEISDVHTHPEYRRRGYGSALVQNVVRRAHEHGLAATYSVHPDNRPSLALAAAVGFQPAFRWERVILERH